MKQGCQFIAVALLLGMTGVALAGNKHVARYDYKNEITCPPPVMLPAGPYVGLQVGYDSYSVRETFDALGISSSNTVGANGWVGGLLAGYSGDFNEWFRLAGEVFINTSNAEERTSFTSDDETASNRFTVNTSYGLALLPGIRFTPATVSYLRLGYNWANLKVRQAITGAGTSITETKSNTSGGFNLGIGMETVLVNNWGLRGEFSHTWYNSFTTPNGVKINPSDNQGMLALIYHFV